MVLALFYAHAHICEEQVVGLLGQQAGRQSLGLGGLFVVALPNQGLQQLAFELEVAGLAGGHAQVAQAGFHAGREAQQAQEPVVALGHGSHGKLAHAQGFAGWRKAGVVPHHVLHLVVAVAQVKAAHHQMPEQQLA